MNLNNLPDVQFAEKDPEIILNEMVSEYEKAYYEQTGEQKKLYPGDPVRIFLYSQALREIQLRHIIDFSAKQNLLKYSSGNYLENLATVNGNRVQRLQSSKATVTIKFILSAPQPVIQTIPIGTRVSPGNKIYFETIKNIDIPAHSTEITVDMTCTKEGLIGNGFIPGQINILVDPLPWVANITNIDISQGGSNTEDDESLRERIWLAPESFSTAGPEGAYEFFAKEYSSLISDVKVLSPSPGNIDIKVLLENGGVPTGTFLQGLNNYLNTSTLRPLTDHVVVNSPNIINYDINLTYYILIDDLIAQSSIKAKVNQAIQDYILWQKSKIGRDINPSELTARIIHAGAKRVDITKPIYTAVTDTQVAIASTNITATYGGSEDD